jgi:5-hydroxyisourate hydrolase-like protein (transthyretin family)
MSAISTHVLSLATGFPARNLSVVLESQGPLRTWRKLIGPFGYTTYRGS